MDEVEIKRALMKRISIWRLEVYPNCDVGEVLYFKGFTEMN